MPASYGGVPAALRPPFGRVGQRSTFANRNSASIGDALVVADSLGANVNLTRNIGPSVAAVRGTAAGTTSGQAVTVSRADFSTAPQSGDLLLLVAGGAETADTPNLQSSITSGSGWTSRLDYVTGGGDRRITVWSRTASGSSADDVTVTFTDGAGTTPFGASAVVVAVRNGATLNVGSVVDANPGPGSATPPTGDLRLVALHTLGTPASISGGSLLVSDSNASSFDATFDSLAGVVSATGTVTVNTAASGSMPAVLIPLAVTGTAGTPDTLAVSDALTRSSARARAVADTLAASDSVAGVYTPGTTALTRSISDSVTASDALNGSGVRVRSTADSVTASDVVARQSDRARAATGSLTITDQVTANGTRTRAASDALAPSDTVAGSIGLTRAVADSLAAADAAARVLELARQIVDSVTLAGAAVVVSTAGQMLPAAVSGALMAAGAAPTASMSAGSGATATMTAAAAPGSTMTSSTAPTSTMTGA